MRAAAEVGEVALRVERDVAFGRVDELDLVVLALVGEEALRLLGGDLLALPGAALLELALDLLLDLLERVLADRLRELEVVVEAVLDRRADRDLRPRDRAGARPRREGAPPSGAGRRARRDRPCRASSGSGSAGRPRAAAADPGRARSSARARLPWPASGRSRQPRRAPSRRLEVRVPSSREEELHGRAGYAPRGRPQDPETGPDVTPARRAVDDDPGADRGRRGRPLAG